MAAVKTKQKKKTLAKRKFSARHVIKRHGHKEPFDERKVYASVYEACHAAHLNEKHAEQVADKVTTSVKKWIEKKDFATSHEIHIEVIKALRKHHPDAAFMYETHRDIC